MIDSLEIKRFRSIQEEKIDFGDINILIGRNNSGKSTVLYAMDLLINNFGESFAFDNAETDMGNLPTNVFKNENSGEVSFDIRFDFNQDELDLIRSNLESDGQDIDDLSFLGVTSSIPVSINIENGSVNEVQISSEIYGDNGTFITSDSNEESDPILDDSAINQEFPPLPKSGTTQRVNEYNNIRELFRNLKNNKFFYIHPDRLQENRNREITKDPRHRDVGESGRFVTDVMAYNRDYADMKNNFDEALNWIKKFGFDEPKAKIESGAIHSLQLVDEDLDVQTNVLDIGSGSNQLVSLITQSFFAPYQSIMLVEEPEIHLHPKYQAKLADFFIAAQEFGDHQFFLETHSQHLLTRLQLRVAEEKIDPSQIGLFYFDKDEEGTHINQIQIDRDGDVGEPIPEFFEQDFDDVMDRMNAIREKKNE